MQTDSIELGFLSVFSLITFFIFLLVSKFSYKIKNGILLDKEFTKPQAFHSEEITRSGGIGCFNFSNDFYLIYFTLYSKILYDYIFISLVMFGIGYLDDAKIKVSPNSRLILMIIFLLILINFLPIYISNIESGFLNHGWKISFFPHYLYCCVFYSL